MTHSDEALYAPYPSSWEACDISTSNHQTISIMGSIFVGYPLPLGSLDGFHGAAACSAPQQFFVQEDDEPEPIWQAEGGESKLYMIERGDHAPHSQGQWTSTHSQGFVSC